VDALDTVLDAHDFEAVGAEEFIHDALEFVVVFEEKDGSFFHGQRDLGQEVGDIESGGLVGVALHVVRELRRLGAPAMPGRA
jgi:hypothetical protein